MYSTLLLKRFNRVNSTILGQFEQRGLNINEGVAIDARLVKSASRPVSNNKRKELRDQHKQLQLQLSI